MIFCHVTITLSSKVYSLNKGYLYLSLLIVSFSSDNMNETLYNMRNIFSAGSNSIRCYAHPVCNSQDSKYIYDY